MRRGRLAMAVVAFHAVPAMAATDVSGASTPAAVESVTFSGILADGPSCSGGDCFTGSGALTLGGEAVEALDDFASGVVSAIAAWIDDPLQAADPANAPVLIDDTAGAGGFVIDLESFAEGGTLLQGDGTTSLLAGGTDGGLGLALLELGAEAAPEAEWASACGASEGGATAVTLASIASGCPQPPAQFAGVLDTVLDSTPSFGQNLWIHGNPAGLANSWFFFSSPAPSRAFGGSGLASPRPGILRAPLRLGSPGGSLPQPAILAPGFAPLLANTAPPVSTPSAAVPEPATWALLITGFAMTGAVLRRRKAIRAA